jgi:hypothetical protein
MRSSIAQKMLREPKPRANQMMKPCHQCKTEVSTSVKICPHCGTKWPTANGKMRMDRAAIVVFGLAAAIAMFGYGGGNSASAPVRAVAERAVDFTAKDITAMVQTSRDNEVRFNRDYKNKVFSDVLTFKSVNERTFTSGYQVQFSGAYCFIDRHDAAAQRLIEWNKGHSARVTGVIRTTMFGDVALENCAISDEG